MKILEKRNKLAWILDALALAAVLQYAAFRFLQSTMFVFYYSDTYKMVTMGLLIVFGGARYLYVVWGKLKQREDKKKYIIRCIGAWLLALPFFYVGFLHNYKFLIFLPVCCMCLYDMQTEKVLKAHFVIIGTLLLATVLCSLSGTVRNLTSIGDDGRIIAAYGVINTTDFASYFTFLLLTIWCGMEGQGETKTVLFAVLVAIVSYLVYTVTDSRTEIEIGAVLLVLVLWDSAVKHNLRLQKFGKAINGLSIVVFPIIGLIVVISVFSYALKTPWAIWFDQILTGRLKLTLDSYNTYGIHPFGSLIDNVHGRGGTLLSYGWSSGYGYIDIAYAALAIKYGSVITAIVTGLWIWTTVKALRQRKIRIAFAMAIMAIHAFSEARVWDVNYNIFLVMPFCTLSQTVKGRETEKFKENNWIPVLSGITMVGTAYLVFPHILSWLRTLFSSNNWNLGTAAFNSLMVCIGIVVWMLLLWYFFNKMVQRNSKRIVISIAILICICIASVIVTNNRINGLLAEQAVRLDKEEQIIRNIQEIATQPVYVAEQEELYKRRYGNFANHLISTEEVRKGSILTDSNVEALGIVSTGGMYTTIYDKTGLYSYDPAVINELANKGYDWTPFYSGRRIVNLNDMALFNRKRTNEEGDLELTGPCRVIATNMETDQICGIYEVEFKLSCPELSNNDRLATLEILGDAGERLIKKLDLFASDFEAGRCNKTISYRISDTPKVSYAISVNDKARITIDEISWKGSAVNATEGVNITPEGQICMTTHVADNHFNMIQFQLYSMSGEYIASFGEETTSRSVSGEYIHNLPSGMYYLRFKGNTNRADEWVRIKILLVQNSTIQYSYEIEELSGNRIVVKDVMINGLTFTSLMK